MMYSTDRPADPGALKEFTVIDPVMRPPTSTVPADAIAQEPPRLQIERDPAVRDFDDGPWSNWREQCDLDDMVELITEAPMAAARLLRRICGKPHVTKFDRWL